MYGGQLDIEAVQRSARLMHALTDEVSETDSNLEKNKILSFRITKSAKKIFSKKNLIDEQKHSSKKVWYKNINLEANPS